MVSNSDSRDSNSHFLPLDMPQLLQTLDRELAILHQERSLDQVQQLAQIVQGLATKATQAGLDPIPAIAQRLYQILTALLQQSIPVDSALERLLQQACDAIRLPLTEQIVLGQFDAADVLSGTKPILAQLEARLEAGQQSFAAETDDLFSLTDFDAIEPDLSLSELNQSALDNEDETWALESLFAPAVEDEDLAFDPFSGDESEALDWFETDLAEPSDIARVEFDEPLENSTEVALESLFAEEPTLEIDEDSSAAVVEPATPEEEPLLADLDPAIVADLSPATAEEFLSLDSLFAEETPANGKVPPVAPAAPAPKTVQPPPLAPVPREIAPPDEPDEDTLLLQAIFGEPAIGAPNVTDAEGGADDLLPLTREERQAEPIAHIMPPQGGISDANGMAGHIDLLDALSQPGFSQTLRDSPSEVPPRETLIAESSDSPSWNRHLVSLSRDRLEGLYDLLDALLLHQNQLTQHNSQMQAAVHALQGQTLEPQNGAKLTVQAELEQLEQLAAHSQQTLQEHQHVLGNLRRQLLEAQTLSLKTFLERFAPIVYRFAPDQAPQLQLQVTPLWLDRALLEALDEPIQSLLHCVVTQGAVGSIELRSRLQGADLLIEIHAEGGAGLSPEILHRRALELGWMSADSPMASALDGLEFTVTPELFSWREIAPSDPSYALAKSAAHLRSLGGVLTVQTARDRGITLRLQIPTALAVMQLLICLVQQTPVAFPAAQLQEIILAPVGLTSSDRAPTVVWQGQAIPIYRLDDRLSDLPAQPHPESPLSATKFPAHWPAPVLIVAGARPVAFEVSALVNQQEAMVNPPKLAAAPAYLHGHAILENGTTIPVMDGWMLAELLKTGADPY